MLIQEKEKVKVKMTRKEKVKGLTRNIKINKMIKPVKEKKMPIILRTI